MKKSELIFSAVLVPLDYILVLSSLLFAYFLRFDSFYSAIRPATELISFPSFLSIAFIVAFIAILVFAAGSLYSIGGTEGVLEEIAKVFFACSATVMIMIVFLFFQREFFASRFIILLSWFLAFIFVSMGRVCIRFIQRKCFQKGIGVHRTALIGPDTLTEKIQKIFEAKTSLGFLVVKRFEQWDESSRGEIIALRTQNNIDEVIVVNPNARREDHLNMLDFCEENHLVYKYGADIFDTHASHVEVETIGGIPIIEIKRSPLDGWGKIMKRMFDFFLSFILIALASPLMLLAAFLIALNSRGPIFFFRKDDGSIVTRIGQFGKPFVYFKFRTMVHRVDSLRYSEELQAQNARKGSPLVKIVNDPRITRVGKVLRRFSIDELTELFLVLRGSMSLVGPRPHLPEEVALYEKRHKKVLSIKPGITGLAQISGRSDLDFEEEVRLDCYYIEHWSLLMDLIILLRTPMAVLRSRRTL